MGLRSSVFFTPLICKGSPSAVPLYHFASVRGRDLVALWIATSIVAGMLMGWSGHKASLRIRVWGQNMNQQDRIFREVSGTVEDEDSPRGSNSDGTRGHPVPTLGSRQLPIGAAGPK